MEGKKRCWLWHAQGVLFLALIYLWLPGCVTTSVSLTSVRQEFGTTDARRDGFWHCSGHGCRYKQRLAFDEKEWQEIRKVFGVKTPEEGGEKERRKIRHAIALIEDIVGKKTGTDKDLGGSFSGIVKGGQMDCVDEMLNVATYVSLLIEEGLVTEHQLGKRYTNQLFKTGAWPHTATSIVEITTGNEYVVDSWWLRNGSLPYMVPLEQWSEGDWSRPTSKEVKRAAERVGPNSL